MKGTLGTKIGGGFALALIAVLILGVLSYRSIQNLIETTQITSHTLDVRYRLSQLLSGLQDAETGQRGYLLTGDETYLEPFQTGSQAVNTNFTEVRRLTSDNPNQQRRLEELQPLIQQREEFLKKGIDLRREKGFAAALQIVVNGTGKKLMDEARAKIREMDDEERGLLDKRTSDAGVSARNTVYMIAFGVPIVLALKGIISLSLIRDVRKIKGEILEVVNVAGSSGSEILASTTQLASSAAETASAVSQTSVTVEEVKQTAQVSSQKAKSVSEIAKKASDISETGRKAVDASVEGMRGIQQQMESIAGSILKLSEQTQAIGEIIATVNDLTEQSNILAVNAAIEAAKAGDQGRGFSVVAQEIKSLSDQSRQATTQVRSILGDIQKATNAAVMVTEQGTKAVDLGVKQTVEAGESIRLLSEAIVASAQATTQIAAASQQEVVGMDQVAIAMESIKQASAQNASAAKQSETGAQNLNQASQKLKSLVQYKL
jgi:methyl-accepting chemotaxis protein